MFIKPKESWTHDFCLLSRKNETKTPTVASLLLLKEAGLGKRRITFDDKKSGHGKVRQVLETIFPKLKGQSGAFELLRGVRGGTACDLIQIDMSPQGYTVPYLKDQVSANTVIYVRPMQSDLPMSKVITQTDESIKSSCRNCSKDIPLANMRAHLQNCTSTISKPDDLDGLFDDEFSEDEELDEISWRKEESEKMVKRENTMKNIPADVSTAYCPYSVVSTQQKTPSQKEEWKATLGKLFTFHTAKQIENALTGCASLEEAANNLMESNVMETQASELQVAAAAATEKWPPPLDIKHKKINLNSLLGEFRAFQSSPGIEEVTVQRDSLWSDVLKFYKRKCNDPNSLRRSLEVQFKGEEGLDGGAMKVEFFNMAWEQVTKRLFEGNVHSIVPIKDITKTFLFRLTGIMTVHTVMQNGPIMQIPRISQSIIASMIGEKDDEVNRHLSKHDIPLNSSTENLHYLIEELDSAKNDECITKIFDSERKEAYWQIVNASHWPTNDVIRLANKNAFIQELIYNEIIRLRSESIKEIRQGLEMLGFLPFMARHPTLLKEIFLPKDRNFGPEEFKNLLQDAKPTCFSESQALEWLMEFIDDGDKPVADDDQESRVAALLAFATGWEFPPAHTSNPKIKVEFLPDDDAYALPTAMACLCILRIPSVHTTKRKFEDAILTALKHERRGFANP